MLLMNIPGIFPIAATSLVLANVSIGHCKGTTRIGWKKGSPPHKALVQVVFSKRFLRAIPYYLNFRCVMSCVQKVVFLVFQYHVKMKYFIHVMLKLHCVTEALQSWRISTIWSWCRVERDLPILHLYTVLKINWQPLITMSMWTEKWKENWMEQFSKLILI